MNIHIERIASGVTLLTALIFVIFSIYLFGHLDENFRPVIALICAIVLITTDVLYRRLHTEKWMSKKNFAVIELLGSIQMSLNGIGSLGLYTETKYFDISKPLVDQILPTEILVKDNIKYLSEDTVTAISANTASVDSVIYTLDDYFSEAYFSTDNYLFLGY